MKDQTEKPGGAFDLIVLGAGSAGFSAAITAADAGRRVALVGHGTIGGACVNVGCVPSKTMIRAAEAVHGARAASRFPGLMGAAHLESWAKLVAAKDDLVSALRQKKYSDVLPQHDGVEYIDEGPARLVPGGITTGPRRIEAPRIIIATGSRPRVPDIPGIEGIGALTSATLMELKEQPESLIFVGGGYVGVELAQMMSRLGTKVTIVTRSTLLGGTEPEVAENLQQALEAEGITVLAGVAYQSVRREGKDVVLSLKQGSKNMDVTAQALVSTAGRVANTEDLDLPGAGVKQDSNGHIRVGKDMQTTAPGIYAAGDVTDLDQYVYMAAYGAKLAARNAVLGASEVYDNSAMPWVVFTDPQVAGAGLSEAQAAQAGHRVKTSVLPLDQVPRALAARDTRGVIKLVADADSDVLLGGQILAPEGADAVQALALALKFKMTAKDLGGTIFPYLTTVEGLKLAAQTFDMDVEKLSCCAG